MDFAKKHNIKTISDLAKFHDARLGLTHEIMNRSDGYTGLKKKYGFKFNNVKTLQHQLAYSALEKNDIDVTDVYSTDAEIIKYNLCLLLDTAT